MCAMAAIQMQSCISMLKTANENRSVERLRIPLFLCGGHSGITPDFGDCILDLCLKIQSESACPALVECHRAIKFGSRLAVEQHPLHECFARSSEKTFSAGSPLACPLRIFSAVTLMCKAWRDDGASQGRRRRILPTHPNHLSLMQCPGGTTEISR